MKPSTKVLERIRFRAYRVKPSIKVLERILLTTSQSLVTKLFVFAPSPTFPAEEYHNSYCSTSSGFKTPYNALPNLIHLMHTPP